ncbi:hypothetical protein Plhal304r1_c001g0002761 [Plasmopara halstedii]
MHLVVQFTSRRIHVHVPTIMRCLNVYCNYLLDTAGNLSCIFRQCK